MGTGTEPSAPRAGGGWRLGWLAVGIAALTLAVTLWSWGAGGLVAKALDPAVPMTVKVEAVRDAVAATGPLAPLVYVAFVTVEVVVAPLPGFLLYAPGGVLFGGFWGGLLALVGNVLGAAVAFGLTRRLGRERAAEWLQSSHLADIERRLSNHGFLVVFLLRVNPLTSSDVVSYAAGLTSMPAGRLLAGTALGLAPLCWIQAYAADGLLAQYPWLLYPAVGAAVAYLVIGVVVAIRLSREVRRRRG